MFSVLKRKERENVVIAYDQNNANADSQLFAHGGGYALGHGLQNLSMFRRLTKKAKLMGRDIAFVSVRYRESLSFSILNKESSFPSSMALTTHETLPEEKSTMCY